MTLAKLPLRLRLNLEHAIPVECALAAAGFAKPDLSAGVMSGYLMVGGVERYYEARLPREVGRQLEAEPSAKVVELDVVFRCTFQPAEP